MMLWSPGVELFWAGEPPDFSFPLLTLCVCFSPVFPPSICYFAVVEQEEAATVVALMVAVGDCRGSQVS